MNVPSIRILVSLALCASFFIPAAVQADHHEAALDVGGVEGDGGTVKGTVKFDGKQIPRKPIRMNADPVCEKAHQDAALSQKWVFGSNDTLQNVFVWVSKGLEGKTFDTPTTPAVLDQRGCMYIPHVSGIVVNQPLEIRSSDDTLHNINFKSDKNGTFNLGMPVKGMKETKTFTKEEVGMTYKCDVHPWMNAFMHVVPHPFFAVTQEYGTFTLKGLPPGEYELSVWHEFDRFAPDKKTAKVTVEAGKTAEVTFTYAPAKKE